MSLSLKIIAVLIAVVFFSIPILMGDRLNRRQNRDIQTRGHIAEAEILNYIKQKYLYVEYKFTPKGQQTPIISKKRIGGWPLRRLPVGTVVRVWYLENAPSISVLEPYLANQDAAS